MNPVLVSMFGEVKTPRRRLIARRRRSAPIHYTRPRPIRLHGPFTDLSDPEMGIAFTSIISAIGAGVAAAAKGIGGAVSKGKAAKAARKAESERAAAAQAVIIAAAQAKRRRTQSLVTVGILAAAGVGAVLLTKG